MYTFIKWKCHNETSCVAILNKQNFFFFYKMGEQEGVLVPVEGGGDRDRVWKGEHSVNTVYTCM
jgi:hypothetical protein